MRDVLIDILTDKTTGERCRHIQGFQYGSDHVVRDIGLPADKQEIWRAPRDYAALDKAMDRARAGIRVDFLLARLDEAGLSIGPKEQHVRTAKALSAILGDVSPSLPAPSAAKDE